MTPLMWFCVICALYYIFGWTRPVLWFMHVLWSIKYWLITILLAVVVPAVQLYRSDDTFTHGNTSNSIQVVVFGTLLAMGFVAVFQWATGQDEDE